MSRSGLWCPLTWSARVLNQNLCIFETIRANILRVNKKLRQRYGSEQNFKRVYSSSLKYVTLLQILCVPSLLLYKLAALFIYNQLS